MEVGLPAILWTHRDCIRFDLLSLSGRTNGGFMTSYITIGIVTLCGLWAARSAYKFVKRTKTLNGEGKCGGCAKIKVLSKN